MNKRRYIGAAILIAVAVAAGGAYWFVRSPNESSVELVEVSKPVPDFTLPDLQGKLLKLSSLHGKTVLLDFWATWCGPCLEDIPQLIALQRKFGKQGFVVVGVSLDDASVPEIAAFVREHRLNYQVVLTGGQDKIPEGYDVFGLPTAYLIDSVGVVRRKYYGPKDASRVAKDVQEILRHEPS